MSGKPSLDALLREASAAFDNQHLNIAAELFAEIAGYRPFAGRYNRGVALKMAGRYEEAELELREALEVDPTSALAEFNLAQVVLGQGRFAEGWRYYEARRRLPNSGTPTPRVPYPEWRGETVSGKHVLVVKEQGLGDQIMAYRYVKLLMEHGAHVTFVCDPSLARLFSINAINALPAQKPLVLPPADFWISALSLPRWLGPEPSGTPYLSASPVGSGGVGVMTSGSRSHSNDRNRSLPPADAARLRSIGTDLSPEATVTSDFLDTARLVAGLDRVITVDTSVAHLAGALGVPVSILLPAIDTDWRWQQRKPDTPWYDSARLFRQVLPGEWRSILDEVSRYDLSSVEALTGRQ